MTIKLEKELNITQMETRYYKNLICDLKSISYHYFSYIKYEGDWNDNKREGKATYYYANGEKVQLKI